MRDRRDMAEITGLVWPAAFSALMFTLMEVVDAVMLGAVGLAEMAGALLATTVIYLVLIFPMQVMRALAPLAAPARDRRRIGELSRLSLVAALGLGLAATAAVMAISATLPLLGYEPALLSAARSYLSWRAPFLAVELAFFGSWAMLEGFAGTRAPLLSGVICIGTNVVMNLVLIPGWGGLPRMGAAGAALATDLAMVVGLLVLQGTCRRRRRRMVRGEDRRSERWWGLAGQRRVLGIDRALARRFLSIGWPLGVAGFLDVLGWLVIGLIIPRLGSASAASHGLLSQLISVSLAVAQGSAVAATILVARAASAGDRAEAHRRARQVLRVQLAVGLGLGLLVLGGGEIWASLFTDDVEVHRLSAPLLGLVALIVIFEGLTLVVCGAIEGTGRTRVLLLATLLFDVLFGTGAVALGSPEELGAFYWIWLGKNVLKLGFLLAWLTGGRLAPRLELLRWLLGRGCAVAPALGASLVLPLAPRPSSLVEQRWWLLPVPDH